MMYCSGCCRRNDDFKRRRFAKPRAAISRRTAQCCFFCQETAQVIWLHGLDKVTIETSGATAGLVELGTVACDGNEENLVVGMLVAEAPGNFVTIHAGHPSSLGSGQLAHNGQETRLVSCGDSRKARVIGGDTSGEVVT